MDVELPAEASSAAVARAAVRDLMRDLDADTARGHSVPDEQAVDRVLLLTSEIVTNAVLHARTPLRLTAWVEGGQVVVRVYDKVGIPPRRRSYRADAGTGRGMHLVEALADGWGVEQTSAGKFVWFTVAVSAGDQAASIG